MGIYDEDKSSEYKKKNYLKTVKKPVNKKHGKPSKKPKDGLKTVLNNSLPIVPTEEVKPKITPEQFFSSISSKPEYIKHLIECRCILPQFINLENPINHKFIVFSELDENANVKQSYVQCNNCGIIHRITEVGISYTLKKESMMSLPLIDDLKTAIPTDLTNILEKHQCSELHIWQEVKFILDNELWGRFIVLAKEHDDDIVNGKTLQILGKELYKIEIFERDDSDVKPE